MGGKRGSREKIDMKAMERESREVGRVTDREGKGGEGKEGWGGVGETVMGSTQMRADSISFGAVSACHKKGNVTW